jgi:hypothetical protein
MMRVVSLALTLQLASALPRQLQKEGGKTCFDGKDNVRHMSLTGLPPADAMSAVHHAGRRRGL